MVVYRRVEDDAERVVVLKRTTSGTRRVLDTYDQYRRYDGDDDDGVKVYILRRGSGGILRVESESHRSWKKQSRALRPLEKRTRKMLSRGVRVLNVYLDLHDRSNRKKKNGWARDYFRNVNKAFRRTGD